MLDQQIRDEVERFKVPGRSGGAAFLAWFLVNVFRLDQELAPDSVCDSTNDKGIDGIVLDDAAGEAVLFQSKYAEGGAATQGDNDLRNFDGAAKWFSSPDSVEELLSSTGSQELKSLVRRCDVAQRLSEGYVIRQVFISCKAFDDNAREYLRMRQQTEPPLNAWDSEALNLKYARMGRDEKIIGVRMFSLPPGGHYAQNISEAVRVIIAPLKARELAELDGIDDRSIFARNVRFGLGGTRVNRDIKGTIDRDAEHVNFLLYHNGITIVCEAFSLHQNTLRIENYGVVNGCQSMITFFDNRESLSDRLLVLTKIVQVGTQRAPIADDITYYNNNQNTISMRDLRSNDRIQIELQNNFRQRFGGGLFYSIKRGEEPPDGAEVIENSLAAQVLLAFYNKEPENAHQKYRLFDQSYRHVFTVHTTVQRIHLAYRLYRALTARFDAVEDKLIRDYSLSRFFMLYVMRLALEKDPLGATIIHAPGLPLLRQEDHVMAAAGKLAGMLVVAFNYLVQQRKEKGYFDYKSDLKSHERVREMALEILRSYEMNLVMHPEESFSAMLTQNGALPAESFFGQAGGDS